MNVRQALAQAITYYQKPVDAVLAALADMGIHLDPDADVALVRAHTDAEYQRGWRDAMNQQHPPEAP